MDGTKSEELYSRWAGLCSVLGVLEKKARNKINEIFDRLVAAYCEPHRKYHTLEHILHCLRVFDGARDLTENQNAVEMAIWFHDFVYNTSEERAKFNEALSSAKAYSAARELGLSHIFGKEILCLILATKFHEPIKVCKPMDIKVLIDVDLSSLGKAWSEFQKDSRAVREEYGHVPEAVFREKRAEILQGFLSRPRIYFTDYFYEKYEKAAQENLKRAIDELKTGD